MVGPFLVFGRNTGAWSDPFEEYRGMVGPFLVFGRNTGVWLDLSLCLGGIQGHG